MPNSLHSHRPALAITLKLCAITMFVTTAAMIKATAEDVPPGEAVFFRSALAIPVILIWLASRGELRQGLIPRNLRGHLMRGIFGTVAMGLSFAGLALLPLPEVTAIGYATPIFTLILATVMLGERIRIFRISAVVLGLIGVMVMLWPRLGSGADLQDGATLGAIMILAATLCRSLVQVHIRQLVQTEHTAAVVFYFSITATVLSLLTAPFGWRVPPPDSLVLLVACGVIGSIAQIVVTSAYRFGPASMLAPYDYSSMLVAIVIGFVWFEELPTFIMLAGATLVIAGNALVLWREHQLGRDQSRARATGDPRS